MRYIDHIKIARAELAIRFPHAAPADLDKALAVTWVDDIETDDWVARASRRFT